MQSNYLYVDPVEMERAKEKWNKENPDNPITDYWVLCENDIKPKEPSDG